MYKRPQTCHPLKRKTTKNKKQDGMSQENRYFRKEIYNPKLQDI